MESDAYCATLERVADALRSPAGPSSRLWEPAKDNLNRFDSLNYVTFRVNFGLVPKPEGGRHFIYKLVM